MTRKPPLLPADPAPESAPLAYSQEGLWFLQQLDAANTAYTVPLSLRLAPEVTRTSFEAALTALVDRHDALRLRFQADGSDAPTLRVGPGYLPEVRWHETVDDDRWHELVAEVMREPFDLTSGRLVRGVGAPAPGGGHRVCLAIPHIVADGWSVRLISRDLAALHSGTELPRLPVTFADFATWQRGWLRGEALDAEVAYWRDELATSTPLVLPTDFTPGPMTTATAAVATMMLPAEVTADLLAVARSARATGFVATTALVAALLARWTSERDLLLGTATAGRTMAALTDVVGNFVNTVALRVDLTDDPSFRELLGRVRTKVLQAMRHADAPFHHVVADLAPRRDLHRQPVFNVVIAHQEFTGAAADDDGAIRLEPQETAAVVASHFDLDAETAVVDGQLSCLLIYRADLFAAPTIERLRDHLVALARQVAREPDTPLFDLPLTGDLAAGLPAEPPPAPEVTLLAAIAEHARHRPDTEAVATDSGALTYAELVHAAEGKAAGLRQAGVGRGDVVAVSGPLRPEAIVDALAVLRCGAAYTLVDPGDPPVPGVTHHADTVAALDADPGEDWPTPLDVAVLQVTPDGPVLVDHGNLAAVSAGVELGPDEPVLLLDGFPLAFWAVLRAGGTCLLADSGDVVGEVSRHAPSTLLLTAEQLADVIDADPDALDPVDTVVVAGDPVALAELPVPQPVRRTHSRAETTGIATACTAPAGEPRIIGTPVDGATAHVLDERMRPVPPGMVGRLYLGGSGVTVGYHGQPARTAERYRPDPFGPPGGRLFDTGDRAFVDTDGNLRWFDRRDRRVTVGGVPVDLAEVERVLTDDPRVRRAAVVSHRSGGRTRLAAFVDTAPEQLTGVLAGAARAVGGAALPEHAEVAPDLPAEPDHAALLARLRRAEAAPDPERVAGYERLVGEVWRKVLGIDDFTVTDSFFDVGGHSLLALPVLRGVQDATGITLPLASLFDFPTVRDLARHLADRDDGPSPLRRPDADRHAPAPLTHGQEALWILDQLGEAQHAFNVPISVRLAADADRDRVEQAVATLIRRHEALRTRYEAGPDGTPHQVVIAPYPPALAWHDLRDLTDDAARRRTSELFSAVYTEPFDLAGGRVLRGIVVRDRTACTVLLACHHIAVDAWSRAVLTRELRAAYRGETLPEPAAQMADVAHWQRRQLTGEVLDQKLRYWQERLAGAPPLELPTSPRRTSGSPSTDAGMVTARWDPEVTAGLLRLAASEQVTPYAAVASLLAACLAPYTTSGDVVFGSSLTGRLLAEMADLVGLLTNTVMLRADATDDPSFRTLLRRMRTETMTAQQHQDTPYELVVPTMGGQSDGGRNPLSDVLLVHTAHSGDELAAALDRPGDEPPMAVGPRFGVEVHTTLLDDTLALVVIFRSASYDTADMRALLDRMNALAVAVVEQPDRALSDVRPVERPEPRLAAGPVEPVPFHSPVAMIDDQAARHPDAVAVVDETGCLSYAELVTRANRYARHLRETGIRRGDVVAVCRRRDVHRVVVLLGILKAGAAYLPLDPTHPPRRIHHALQQARPALLVADDLGSLLATDEVPVRDYQPDDPAVAGQPPTPPEVELGPDDLANVLFTSGSTGTPKGVAVPHGALANFFHGARHWLALAPGDRMLQLAPHTFDVATLELLAPLCAGAATISAPVDVLADDLATLVHRYQVTVVFLVPPLLDLAIDRGVARLAPLRRIVSGGDVIATSSFNTLHCGEPPRRLMPVYGPTETAVIASVLTGDDLDDGEMTGPVPIGRPVANVHWYVMDSRMRPVPRGTRGEIYIGGAGVTRGYLGRPDLTADRFLPDPFGPPGSRMYRTGDLGRQRPDGVMEFGGRADTQVKIRGYRIELEEIEHAMRSHPQVRFAAAKVHRAETGPVLVGYFVPEDDSTTTDPEEIRRHLADLLPPYAVPAVVETVPTLPLSIHGKLDRDALPEPRIEAAPDSGSPRTSLEGEVTKVWSAVLGRQVGVHDDFFAAGGHSLLVVHATDRLRADLGWDVPLRLLFDHPSVARYAAALERLRQDGERPTGVVHRRQWRSQLLGTLRRVDLYVPPGYSPAAGDTLLVAPDGSDFVDVMRAPGVLDDLAHAGRIPPTPALFVSHPDWSTRQAELSEGVAFVDALMAEAVPLACEWLGLDPDRVRVVAAGASLGAVAAVTAAVRHPRMVDGVLALSGPLWWSPAGEEPGWLLRRSDAAPGTRFHVYAAEGDDPRIRAWSVQLADALTAAGNPVRHVAGPGGHTFATWQDHLPEALGWVLSASARQPIEEVRGAGRL
ncbi:amino acid adenylation domain-containing protein [Micromonospora sp. DT48]|uniref:amino acid adenylation domain-containing protein n=1 Tax=Micromonospora sp. DT48 TaxID=3393429 RepID=UPI003CF2CA7B